MKTDLNKLTDALESIQSTPKAQPTRPQAYAPSQPVTRRVVPLRGHYRDSKPVLSPAISQTIQSNNRNLTQNGLQPCNDVRSKSGIVFARTISHRIEKPDAIKALMTDDTGRVQLATTTNFNSHTQNPSTVMKLIEDYYARRGLYFEVDVIRADDPINESFDFLNPVTGTSTILVQTDVADSNTYIIHAFNGRKWACIEVYDAIDDDLGDTLEERLNIIKLLLATQKDVSSDKLNIVYGGSIV